MRRDPRIRRHLGNVCAADELPMTITYRPRTYIVNTDERYQPGSHWVVFYFPRRGPTEFFDSNGYPPEHYHKRFKKVLLKNGRYYIYNKHKVQAPGTMTCGQFCLFYSYYRCRGYTIKDIVNLLKDPIMNDRIVTRFVHRM